MTANEMIPAVGKTVGVVCENWVIPMVVRDVKESWGRVRLLVAPQDDLASGEQWVEMGRVKRITNPDERTINVPNLW